MNKAQLDNAKEKLPRRTQKGKTLRKDLDGCISFYLPDEDLRDRLALFCEKEGRSRSKVLTLMIKRTLPLFETGDLKLMDA